MKNKRGAFFGLYLILLIFAFGALDIMFYLNGQAKIQSAIVNPGEVLKMGYSYDLFELREKELIFESLNSVDKSYVFGNAEFTNSFREILIQKTSTDPLMRNFILEGIAMNGKELTSVPDNLFESGLYPSDSFRFSVGELSFDLTASEEDMLHFSRGSIGKKFTLVPGTLEKISFPVKAYFEYSADYQITFDGTKYFLEVL
jgi:hypothetical protein